MDVWGWFVKSKSETDNDDFEMLSWEGPGAGKSNKAFIESPFPKLPYSSHCWPLGCAPTIEVQESPSTPAAYSRMDSTLFGNRISPWKPSSHCFFFVPPRLHCV